MSTPTRIGSVDFTPIPRQRVIRPPYQSMWRAAPIATVLAWGLSGIALAAWIWAKAPLLDDRPDLPHID